MLSYGISSPSLILKRAFCNFCALGTFSSTASGYVTMNSFLSAFQFNNSPTAAVRCTPRDDL